MGISRNTTPDGIYMAIGFLLTPAETADILRCSIRSVWRRVADGSLQAVKLGRTTRIPGESVKAYVRAARDAVVRAEVAQSVPLTLGLLNTLACEVAERDGRDPARVIALLAKFGVKHLGDVPVERRAEFRDKLLKL